MSVQDIFECSAVELQYGPERIVVLSIYRIPNLVKNEKKMFLKGIESALSNVFNEECKVFLAGDFNIDLFQKNDFTAEFLNMLSSFCILPSVLEATRIAEGRRSCIDNIYTNCIDVEAEILNAHISDHEGQLLTFQVTGGNCKQKSKLLKRTFSDFNKEMFKHALKQQNWGNIFQIEESNVSKQWECFMGILLPLFEQSFPEKAFSLGGGDKLNKNKYKYDSPEIIQAKNELDILFTLKQNNSKYAEFYRESKVKYNKLLSNSRKQHYAKRIQNSDNKSKSVWQIVNEIKGSTRDKSELQLKGECSQIANQFNDYTINSVSEMVEQLPQIPFSSKVTPNAKTIFLKPLTVSETANIISNLKNKYSAGFDEISNNIIKYCNYELAEPLTYIVNNSYKTGIFPDGLKLSLVKPLHKKGDPTDLKNYRPISLASSFSKIFELAMTSRLLDFFYKNNLISTSQHGYLKNKSIETAVYDFLEKICVNLENKKFSMGLFLDFSKAFDSLDHEILLQKLELYGIRGRALEWITAFLAEREQVVVVEKNGEKFTSKPARNPRGIPQGSVLGPLLFVFYINDFSEEIHSREASLVNFADDSNVHVSSGDFAGLVEASQSTLRKAEKWCIKNKLIINREKSQFIAFRTFQSNKNYPDTVNLNSTEVNLTDTTKFLGIYVNQNLDWTTHIQELNKRLNRTCYSLRVMKNYLDLHHLKTIYYANFQSHLRFGIIFWGGSSETKNLILKTQKRVVRLLLGLKSSESCRTRFKELNILTAPGLYVYECLLFLFKNRDKFRGFLTDNSYNTRHQNYQLPKHRLSLTERLPTYACMRFFNRLPQYIKTEGSMVEYRRKVYELILQDEPYTIEEFLEHKS